MTASRPDTADGLEETVRFLSRTEAYPERPAAVERVETHFSYVFLTDRRVYKLKKPQRYPRLDLSTLAARHANCLEEVRLNRVLSPDVYLGVVPLYRTAAGGLSLSEGESVVDYLVQMVRLDSANNLENRLKRGDLTRHEVAPAAECLVQFYRDTEPAGATDVTARRRRHAREAQELMSLVDDARAAALRDRLLDWLDGHPRLLARRLLVDAHGDLRPQHIYLGNPPRIIDRLEFDARLRRLDPLEELAFLTLECQRLGARWAGDTFLARYMQDGEPPRGLEPYYQASRSLVWALLSARHLVTSPQAPARWIKRTRRYLELGLASLP